MQLALLRAAGESCAGNELLRRRSAPPVSPRVSPVGARMHHAHLSKVGGADIARHLLLQGQPLAHPGSHRITNSGGRILQPRSLTTTSPTPAPRRHSSVWPKTRLRKGDCEHPANRSLVPPAVRFWRSDADRRPRASTAGLPIAHARPGGSGPGVFNLLFVVATGLGTFAFGRVYGGFVQDDAYVTYRYARNLAAGEGFVYNPDDYVLGTSTPLYALTLAFGATVTGLSIPEAGRAVGLVSLWIAALALYGLGRAKDVAFSAVASLLFLTNPFLRHMVGMETFFVLAMLLLAVWAYVGRRLWLVSILTGALVVSRYEMVFFAGILALAYWLERRRLPMWLWPAVAMAGAWLLYASLTFGSPIPLSSSAKLASPRVAFPVGFLFYYSAFVSEQGWLAVHGFLFLIGIVILVRKRDVHLAYGLILIWTAAYFVLAGLLAGSFPWYYGPLIPGVAIAIASGTKYVASLPPLLANPRGSSYRTVILDRVPFLLLSGAILVANLAVWLGDWRSYQGGALDHRFEAFHEVSAWLLDHATKDETLAASEIGYIGYLTDMKIIDLYGLVTPGVQPWLPYGLTYTASRVIAEYSPNYVLIDTSRGPTEAYGLDARYSLAETFPPRYVLYAREPSSE